MGGKDDSSRGGRPRPTSPAAKARSAAALRENLQRRKAQARAQEENQDAAPENATPTAGGPDDPPG